MLEPRFKRATIGLISICSPLISRRLPLVYVEYTLAEKTRKAADMQYFKTFLVNWGIKFTFLVAKDLRANKNRVL